jgi:dolichol-phosphate mannosyltransferase
VTVVVPTFNEGGNVRELVRQLAVAMPTCEVLFVDDSTDDTPRVIEDVAATSEVTVRLIARGRKGLGGLAGAVAEGITAARGKYVVVMDGDLQHPPALVPELVALARHGDMSVASRYCGDGDASGLSGHYRRLVSSGSTALARGLFPRRVGHKCTDPMTGFFCVRRNAIDLHRLRPRGFKILLEVLATHDLRVAETPFVFGVREEGESKASWKNGLDFLYQIVNLRLGRASRFAAVGAIGMLVNLGAMWAMVHLLGLPYLAAAFLATQVAIAHNFTLQERFVFRDVQDSVHPRRARLTRFLLFNNVETALRTPLLLLLVNRVHVLPVTAQALTITVAFLARFSFVSQVLYSPGSDASARTASMPALVGGNAA